MSDEFDETIDAELRQMRAAARNDRSARGHLPVARLASRLYGAATGPLRARMLAFLLRPLSVLSLAAIGGGTFANYLFRRGSPGTWLLLEDVDRYTNEQIMDLARFVEQVNPDALQQCAYLVLEHPVGIAAFSASVAMLLLRSLASTTAAKPAAAGEHDAKTHVAG